MATSGGRETLLTILPHFPRRNDLWQQIVPCGDLLLGLKLPRELRARCGKIGFLPFTTRGGRKLGRTCPDLDARLFFDPDEIRGAHLLTKKKMPTNPPTVNEVVRLIAQVGGFLGRKSDGEPGAKTIWRGLDQVHAAAETLRALREGLG